MSTTMNHGAYYIKYYPNLSKQLGNQNTVLILDRLEYWFTKYQEGFYKFLEPCNHPCYRSGDSWEEEVGLTRRLFNKAFDLIGVRYKSKTAFLDATDPFQGKPYASYHDRKTNRTHFVRNPQLFEKFFKAFEDIMPISTSAKKGLEKSCSRNDKNGHSYAGAIKDKQKNTSSSLDILKQVGDLTPKGQGTLSSNGKKKDLIEKEKKAEEGNDLSTNPHELMEEDLNAPILFKELIETWEETIGPLDNLSRKAFIKKQLQQSFTQCFEGKIDRWKAYCLKIASSKFLMGEERKAKTFKCIQLYWALKPETIEKIESGVYTTGDRQLPQIKAVFQDSQKQKSYELIETLGKTYDLNDEVLKSFNQMARVGGAGAFIRAFGDLTSFKLKVHPSCKRIEIEPQTSFMRFLQERFVRSIHLDCNWTVEVMG